MRINVTLKSPNNDLKIPFNYNHVFSGIIYNKINDLDLAFELHSSKSFKFFTFSQINISKKRLVKNGFISKNGKISFYISSPNEYLIKSLIQGFLDNNEVKYIYDKLFVEKIELIKDPEIKGKMEFKSLSPIIVKIKKNVDGNLKQWDLAPGERFYKALEKNLIKKYVKFNNLDSCDKKIKIYSEMKNVKRKRISIEKGPQTTYHRAYVMDIILEGDLELIKFAYDCGLGEKNSMGFGCIK